MPDNREDVARRSCWEETDDDPLLQTNLVESKRGVCRRLRNRISVAGERPDEKIKIGHLTPLTGFLGALGAYAQLGIRMAEEEINQAGGVMGRQFDIISEDSVNPPPRRPRRSACWSRTASRY